MTLRDDVRWVRDAIDCWLHGALPVWPRTWSTKEGEQLADLARQMRRKLFDEQMRNNNVEALREEIEGQRAANAILTEENERLRARLEVSDG